MGLSGRGLGKLCVSCIIFVTSSASSIFAKLVWCTRDKRSLVQPENNTSDHTTLVMVLGTKVKLQIIRHCRSSGEKNRGFPGFWRRGGPAFQFRLSHPNLTTLGWLMNNEKKRNREVRFFSDLGLIRRSRRRTGPITLEYLPVVNRNMVNHQDTLGAIEKKVLPRSEIIVVPLDPKRALSCVRVRRTWHRHRRHGPLPEARPLASGAGAM